jgi:hypothetical protein
MHRCSHCCRPRSWPPRRHWSCWTSLRALDHRRRRRRIHYRHCALCPASPPRASPPRSRRSSPQSRPWKRRAPCVPTTRGPSPATGGAGGVLSLSTNAGPARGFLRVCVRAYVVCVCVRQHQGTPGNVAFCGTPQQAGIDQRRKRRFGAVSHTLSKVAPPRSGSRVHEINARAAVRDLNSCTSETTCDA